MRMRYESFGEEWNEYTCSSGLKLVLIRKPQFYTSAFLMMTPFGSLDVMQEEDSGRRISYEPGTAHFLEHKLFESGAEDVMRTFSRYGANVNAYTTYDSTMYYFTTPAEDIATPLSLLLDFVQDLSISDASVEKEKPIILEELASYEQDPDSRLFLESMRAAYKKHPLRDDIVGNEQSIRRITLAGLQDAYRRNYHPANMTLIAVTPKQDEEMIELVEQNQKQKSFQRFTPIHRLIPEECCSVNRGFEEILMDIEQPKVSVTIRLPLISSSPAERIATEWSLRFSLENHFTAMNPEYQDWINEHVITPYFSYEVEYNAEYAFLYFEDVTDQAEGLNQFVLDEMNRLREEKIHETQILQMKRRVIGAATRAFDHPMDMAFAWGRGILRSMNQLEECALIDSLNPDSCLKAVQKADCSSYSCVKLASETRKAKSS